MVDIRIRVARNDPAPVNTNWTICVPSTVKFHPLHPIRTPPRVRHSELKQVENLSILPRTKLQAQYQLSCDTLIPHKLTLGIRFSYWVSHTFVENLSEQLVQNFSSVSATSPVPKIT
uniref:Uncharacterized protein n=1 Tax=Physcomitrium patens TaxID=3218 RepID=A0A2K1KPX0_PHYPA|nr:hypothetical protein PHYPA_006725 [Physcomitrium patens]